MDGTVVAIDGGGGAACDTLYPIHICTNKRKRNQNQLKVFFNTFKYKLFKRVKDSHSLSFISYSNLSK